MASCGYCGSTILFGGTTYNGQRFCNQECAAKGYLVALADTIDPSEVASHVAQIHQGPCPKCGGPGPVDVSTAYQVWSALVLTSWSNSPEISCRSCGRKRQALGLVVSALAGWWGIPWGLIMTPVQITRNLAGMFRAYDPYRPSQQLNSAVRLMMGSALASQKSPRGSDA